MHCPPGGGVAFSVGSLCWTSSMPVYDTDSKITKNLLRRFSQ
jgi:hypothetical protein